MVREALPNELEEILALYLHLHETSIPEDTPERRQVWQQIMNDPNNHLIVNIQDGRIVSSCVCVIIPNLSRGLRPYAFVENVVTDAAYRGRGCATECLNYAKSLAQASGCYKLMLLTGSKSDNTLRFYRNAGYNSTDKTAFIQWLP